MAKTNNFFSEAEKLVIINVIKSAESFTSGEIKVHLEEKCGDDVLKRARELFHQLKMDDTLLKNGVLIYLAVKDKKFAIIGDVGINSLVPENFWDAIKSRMELEFSTGNFLNGIVYAIEQAGEQLRTYFPFRDDDINELSDEISFGDD
ncbi:MAG: TPM domain-containing protein [Chitinophagales bacterium]